MEWVDANTFFGSWPKRDLDVPADAPRDRDPTSWPEAGPDVGTADGTQPQPDKGGPDLVGTDSGIPTKFHCQSTWNELAVLVYEMGMEPMDAIRAATYWPSVMMGVADRTGTVSEGRLADIIAVRGDVLRYINLLQDVDLVMKGGVLYKQDGRPVESALRGGS